MTFAAPHPHDLLRVLARSEYFSFPDDAEVAFGYVRRDALVVARRAAEVDECVAVGVRGDSRSERYAAYVSREAIVEVLAPAGLVDVAPSRTCAAFDGLSTLRQRWRDLAHAWGPTGSVAFELASGRPVVNDESDLDLLMNMPRPISKEEASRLLRDTRGLACTVDVQVETASGGFALEEYAMSTGPFLMRTRMGPVLTRNPWSLGSSE